MTIKLAEYLLELDKYVVQDDKVLQELLLKIDFPMNFRLLLSAPEDIDQNLFIDIKESEKKSLKINLHYQDHNTKYGLLRVDYNSRHLNPMKVLDTVPEKFRAFAGQWLDKYAGHIHYVVDGYPPLVWAIPLEADSFPVKDLDDRKDYIDVLKAFFHRINLKTAITYYYQSKLTE